MRRGDARWRGGGPGRRRPLLTGCDFDGAYDLPLPGSPGRRGRRLRGHRRVRRHAQRRPASPVMVDDVTVGEVTEVERVGWHARVTMRVRKDVELPDNAIAEIRQVSLLGEKYVALEPPDEDARRAGSATATTSRSPRPAATPRSRRCSARCRSCSAAAAWPSSAPSPASPTRRCRAPGATCATARLARPTSSAPSTTRRPTSSGRMESLNNLTATLNAEKETISGALDAAGPAIKVLADQHDELIACCPRSTGSARSAPG